MPLGLIVFDLDGTLADTAKDLADSVNELRRVLGLPRVTISKVSLHVGQGVKHLLRRMVPALPAAVRLRHPDLYGEFTRTYIRRCTHRTKLYPGTRAVLRAIPRDIVLAVATNKLGRLSRTILRRLGVADRFKKIIGGDDMRVRKPHPAVLLDLMRRYRARPEETLMVGDSRFDMECGRRAGVRLCACTWGFGSRAELQRWKPDFTIRSISGLTAVIRGLTPRG